MKQTIRLNERELKHLIRESVKRSLREYEDITGVEGGKPYYDNLNGTTSVYTICPKNVAQRAIKGDFSAIMSTAGSMYGKGIYAKPMPYFEEKGDGDVVLEILVPASAVNIQHSNHDGEFCVIDPKDIYEIHDFNNPSPLPLREVVNGGWVVESNEAQEAYDLAVQHMGKEYVDDAIVGTLGYEKLAECLAYLFRMWDFREWDNRNSEEEEDDEELYEGKLNEYATGIDERWEPLVIFVECTKEINDMMQWVVNALRKKKKRSVEISKDRLAGSSIIYKIAQKAVRDYNKEEAWHPIHMNNEEKRAFRNYLAQEILDDLNSYGDTDNQEQSTDKAINETLKRIFKNIKKK